MNSPLQLKILSAVWRNPGLSRSDLCNLVGLHANTITRMVEALLQKGYLREGGSTQRGLRGRPRIPLEVDPSRTCVGGLAIGAGAVEAVTLNLLGEPQTEASRVEATSALDIAKAVAALLRKLLRNNPLALGISVTGFVDPKSLRILFSSATPGVEVDLAPLMSRVGETPFVLNSEVHALSERWLMNHGEAEHDDTLVVTLEDGAVGASLLVDGRPNRGCVLGGNELGHMRLGLETDRCYCGGVGCVERIFSTGFLRRAGETATLADALSGVPLTKAAWGIIDLIALALANVTVFTRPQRMVIAGTLTKHIGFRRALESTWRNQLPLIFRERVGLEWCSMKATVSAETAGWLALARVLSGDSEKRVDG